MTALFSRDETELPEAIEANYQKYPVKVCMLIGIPVLSCSMIYDFIIGRYLTALVLAFMLSILLGLFVIIKKTDDEATKNQFYQFFINAFFLLFGLFLVYTIGLEGHISHMPWAFLYAALIFFAFGAVKGLIWTAALYGVLFLFSLYSTPDDLPAQGLKIRFFIAFLLVIVVSFFFELLKKKYQLRLIDQQQSLKESENRYREAYQQLNQEKNGRQQAEKEFHQIENRFREMAEHIREVFWLFDWVEQKVIYVSPAYKTIWGRSVEIFTTGMKNGPRASTRMMCNPQAKVSRPSPKPVAVKSENTVS